MHFLWPMTIALSLQLPGRTAEWRRAGQDSSHLRICGISSMEACWNHDGVNRSVITKELLTLLPQLPAIPLYSSEQQLPLYTFSGQLYKSEEHKLHFVKAEKGCFSGSASAEGVFRKIWKKGKNTHACNPLTSTHTLDSSPEKRGHCTGPTTSGHGDFIPLSSTKDPLAHPKLNRTQCFVLLHLKRPTALTKTSHLNSKV